MTQPDDSVQVIWVDASGKVTEDKDAAVRGELIERLPDGTTRHTLFSVTEPAPTPGP
jgi:hypothetical protein